MSHIGKEHAANIRRRMFYHSQERWLTEEQIQERLINAYPDVGRIIDDALVKALIVLGTGVSLGVAAEYVARFF